MNPKTILSTILFLSLACSAGFATSYYSDPVGGSMSNDGSINSPWGNLQAIFSAGKTFSAGDEILLMDGAHGQSYITGSHTGYVTIKPMPGHSPRIASVQFGSGSYWALDGLTFTADGSGGTFTQSYMLLTGSSVTYIKVENCTFYSAEDSSSWSQADWYSNAVNAVWIRGDHTVFNSNTILNTYFALLIGGDYVEVKNNLIDNFGADAIQTTGSHALYENNVIRDAYIEDYENGNHDDAIQLFNITSGIIDDVVIRNNTIYNFADPITQSMIDDNLVSYNMQGIIVTDGHIENSVAENNLVVGDHFHGITLSGAVNCRIQNNTVMKTPTSVNPNAYAIPWIKLSADKSGNLSTNCTVRNNINSDYRSDGGVNIVLENNLKPASSQYTSVFADYNNFDFTLKDTSVAIDAGVNTDLTATDLAGNPRLVGSAVDQGAYEFQVSPVLVEATDTYFDDQVVIVFDKTVTLPSAEIANNYTLSDGASVLQASLDANGTNITLTTSPLTNGIVYTVTANGVEDTAGNPSSGTTATFQYLCNLAWASSFQDDQFGTHPPEGAFDGDFSTRWSAEGIGEWIEYSFCDDRIIESVDMAFYLGQGRTYSLTIEVSTDGRAFTQVFSGNSAGGTTGLESFDFADLQGKYVRITGSGNSVNLWNNYVEIVIHSSAAPTGYDAWILDYPALGTATNLTDNPDNDTLNNLAEWAMGGNPTDPGDIGHVPTAGIIQYLGADWIEYVYAKRTDAESLGLTYRAEHSTNLMDSVWMDIPPYDTVTGPPDSAGPGFDSVTNWVITTTEGAQFIHLVIETN